MKFLPVVGVWSVGKVQAEAEFRAILKIDASLGFGYAVQVGRVHVYVAALVARLRVRVTLLGYLSHSILVYTKITSWSNPKARLVSISLTVYLVDTGRVVATARSGTLVYVVGRTARDAAKEPPHRVLGYQGQVGKHVRTGAITRTWFYIEFFVYTFYICLIYFWLTEPSWDRSRMRSKCWRTARTYWAHRLCTWTRHSWSCRAWVNTRPVWHN